MTKNTWIAFVSNETIKDLSTYKLTEEDVKLLDYGLKYHIEPKKIIKNWYLGNVWTNSHSLSCTLNE